MTTSPPTSTPSAPATTTGYHRAPAWALTAAAALLVLAVTWVLASRGEVANWERTTFHVVNQAPSWLYGPLWLVMQLGNVAVAMGTALVALAVTRRWRPPVAVLIATGLSWQLAKYVKHVVGRGRPTALLTDVVLPGLDEAGLGFVSGHSAVAFSLATVLAPYVPRRWRWLPFVVATLVAVARVHVGVHLPLDVVGGTALGVGVGALVNLALGTPIDPGPASPSPAARPIDPDATG